MVVLMHSPMPEIGTSGLVLSTISLLTAPCIGLFFMVSGALLLPIKEDARTFLSKRFSKILFPTLFWTLFYLIVIHRPFEWGRFLRQLISIPFSVQGHGIVWFMYVLAGLYLMTPVISPWIRAASKRQIQFYLCLWLITMCYPLLQLVLVVNNSVTGATYYFSGYIGYYVLGYYLKRYPLRLHNGVLLLLWIVPFFVATYCKLQHIAVDFYSIFWYLSIFTVMMCVAWFRWIQGSRRIVLMEGSLQRLIVNFSNASFGVYLIHIFIMRYILWRMDAIRQLDGITQIVVTWVITELLSYAIVRLIAQLPFADYIIGYKKR